MKLFKAYNIKLILGLIATGALITILITQFIWNDAPEFWRHGTELGNVLFNLSIGYIAAYIFYIIDIWIPDIQKRKRINARIRGPLRGTLRFMQDPCIDIIKKYGEENQKTMDQMNEEEVRQILKRIDLINDRASLYFSDIHRSANYGEYLDYNLRKIEELIDGILKLPFDYEIELIELLDQIQKSSYHLSIKSMRISGFGKNVTANGEILTREMIMYQDQIHQVKQYLDKIQD